MSKEIPASFQEFYVQWEEKIRKTVRNRTKIAPHEVDDVVQVILTACFEKKWLEQYDYTYAFSTFIYTYVHTEIQNYINKRDSSNTVRSSGAVRYTSFSSLPVDVNSLENFLDRIAYLDCSFGDTQVEDDIDFNLFLEESKKYKITTVCKSVPCFKVILLRLNIYLGREEQLGDVKESNIINDFICDSLGISHLDLLKVDECIKLLVEKKIEDALNYLREKFLL